jgi:hypothetical protein
MKQTTRSKQAEAHVLDRMLYLLEENSVSHLAAGDRSFADFVNELYDTIRRQASIM